MTELAGLRGWLADNLRIAREDLPGLTRAFQGFVVAGRRQQLSEGEADNLRRYNDELPGVTVRTYDWIVDAAASMT